MRVTRDAPFRYNYPTLVTRDSFLNGLELQLEEEVDGWALEAFWAFVSGGSPLLSAFEWMVMLQQLSGCVDDAGAAEAAAAAAAAPAAVLPEAWTDGMEADAHAVEECVRWVSGGTVQDGDDVVVGGGNGNGNGSSGAFDAGDASALLVADAGGRREETRDVHDSSSSSSSSSSSGGGGAFVVAADAMCVDSGAAVADVTALAQAPAAAGDGDDGSDGQGGGGDGIDGDGIDARNDAPTSEGDSARAAAAVVGGEGGGDVQPEISPPSPTPENVWVEEQGGALGAAAAAAAARVSGFRGAEGDDAGGGRGGGTAAGQAGEGGGGEGASLVVAAAEECGTDRRFSGHNGEGDAAPETAAARAQPLQHHAGVGSAAAAALVSSSLSAFDAQVALDSSALYTMAQVFQ